VVRWVSFPALAFGARLAAPAELSGQKCGD